MSDNQVNNLLGVTMDKIKQMVDVNTVIGSPVTTPDGTTVIPVSRVSYGFASGGSDLPSKAQPASGLFAGGGGAGENPCSEAGDGSGAVPSVCTAVNLQGGSPGTGRNKTGTHVLYGGAVFVHY